MYNDKMLQTMKLITFSDCLLHFHCTIKHLVIQSVKKCTCNFFLNWTSNYITAQKKLFLRLEST
jgi:hypothetical protein